MKKFFLTLALLISMWSSTVFASVETYVGTGEYTMSEYETQNVAQQRAKAHAERNAQEQAGIFIRSRSKMENFKLTEDEITTMTAGIVKILDVDIQPVIVDKSTFKFIATVTVTIDTNEINHWLEREAQERLNLIELNKELRRKNEEQEREIARLKKMIEGASTDQQKLELERKFNQADNEFLAIEKLREGNRLKDHNAALAAYTEAVELNPKLAMAYNNRGYTYTELGRYELAMSDLNKALELEPKLAIAYNNRGRVFSRWNQYEHAIADYNKALELNPNYATAYNNRGYTYDDLKEYDRAVSDYTRAIELNPTFAMAYNNRGFTLMKMKEYERAISDFDRAIELNPKFDWAYNNRGTTYLLMADLGRALADFNKAIECNPNYVKAYNNRGMVYKVLGDAARAQADFDKAKSLGG